MRGAFPVFVSQRRCIQSIKFSVYWYKISLPQLQANGPGGISRESQSKKDERAVIYDVFPRHIAEKLLAGQRHLIQPDSKECVTIFFSDIVGFTDISSKLDPGKVSQMLHRLYTVFDALSSEHQIFKVETIGDAYMAGRS